MRDAASTIRETTLRAGGPRRRRERLGADAGFTIIEVMIAAFVLVVGILARARDADRGDQHDVSSNHVPLGATNLARELVETARGADYDQLTPTLLSPDAAGARTWAAGTRG